MKRPRILLVTIHPCRMPGSGGSVRAHFFARAAAAVGDVTVLTLCAATGQQFDHSLSALCEQVIGGTSRRDTAAAERSPGSAIGVLAAPWRRGWTDFVACCVQHCGAAVQLSAAGWRKWLLTRLLQAEHGVLLQLGLLPPLPCLAWFSEFHRLHAAVIDAETRQPFDLLWLEDVFSWPFAAHLLQSLQQPPKTVICNTYNIESIVAARLAQTAADQPAARVARRNMRQLARMERQACERAELTFVCSDQDLVLGQQLAPAGRFAVVGNGVDLGYFKAAGNPAVATAPVLLLTGTFGYGPNLQGAAWFVREVLPLVRQAVPAVRFVIAGQRAGLAVAELAAGGLPVESVSDPIDIRPCFQGAAVFVVPLLVGGGTRLKILEAMAMGIPVVSTNIGAEGLGAAHGQQLLLADSPSEMASAVVQLLEDAALAGELRDRAMEWVQQNYDWQRLCARAVSLVQSSLDEAICS
ncbi:MAG: glycosyltransferase family 4 protein [Planctomycetaceae bacterium]